MHLLAKIRALPAHRPTPRSFQWIYQPKNFRLKLLVKHASAFATAPPGFLNAKICKAEDIVTIHVFYHELSPVTSAMHMRGTKRLFEAQGNEVVPAPCNFTDLVHPDDSFRLQWPGSESLGL
ncbi:hypothetical protein [Lunatibacter salilacus]|uniref:hypothetical protein n=1 Tax=Lunatibacter salilacus TaxID=2483804 RepID=UPI00131D4AC9|nr:hypothetical protein [Lunatibacter salilacus]